MGLTREELQRISDLVGERVGWDFSPIYTKRDPVPWEYGEVAHRFIKKTDTVLDIGTGGGERFLALAEVFKMGIGVDIDPEMIRQAQRNRANRQVANVAFAVMDGHRLGFREAQFDVVLNRHCEVNVAEAVRILRPGGYFVTQQVGARNTLNFFEAFGWEPSDRGPGQPLEGLAAYFERRGCSIVARCEYDVRYWFCDVASLVFWLKAVPLPEPFDVEKHLPAINRILEKHSTPQGIETNEHRELLIVRKP